MVNQLLVQPQKHLHGMHHFKIMPIHQGALRAFITKRTNKNLTILSCSVKAAAFFGVFVRNFLKMLIELREVNEKKMRK
jgi:hypothetical protein